jgi:hypothetical protein
VSVRLVCFACMALTLWTTCRQGAVEGAASATTGTTSSTSSASATESAPRSGRAAAPKAEAAGAQTAATTVPATDSEKAEDDLQSEEREANPTSETVTLTLAISPPVKASVMWGAKQLARVTPDNPTVELQRPRSSGPVDLEIRAEGFLPHHARLYSDRNDRVSIRLVRPRDASALLGFRSSISAAAAKVKTK